MKQTFKKWFEKQNGYDILNNRTYSDWAFYGHALDFGFYHTLYRKNVDALKSLLGKQLAVYTGEFKFYVWKIEYNGLTFLIFSSNKGTSIEYVGNKPTNSEIVGNHAIKLVDSLVTNLGEWYSGNGDSMYLDNIVKYGEQ